MQQSIEITKLNNELQAEGLKNPTIKQNVEQPKNSIKKPKQPAADTSAD